ncbi:MAG: hypothetical protein Fur0034_14410 [Desulfuromonadia bacterium]
MENLTARDLMSRLLVTTSPGASLLEVLQAMIHENHPCVVVCEGSRPIGIITERDIVRLMARFLRDRETANIPVSDVMSRPLVTVAEDTPLVQALVIANSEQILHLPVVDQEGNLTGILTHISLARAHLDIYRRQQEIIEQSVQNRTKELEEANRALRNLCMIDPLTGIGNRRAMEIDLTHTHSQALRYGRVYSMILFDVDYFKTYNDTFGHAAGDEALSFVCSHIGRSIRQSDRLYRYGGEEILLILPETGLHGTLILAERIIGSFADVKRPHPQSPFGYLTVSCGIACHTQHSPFPTWQAMLEHADRGLYTAKEQGKNRLAILPPEDATDEISPRRHREGEPEPPCPSEP